MEAPLLHSNTEAMIRQFVEHPSHAVLLTAPDGAGKGVVAHYLAAQLLGIDQAKLDNSPYFKHLAAPTGKVISVEQVRDITHFMTRRMTGQMSVNRVVVAEHAGDMTPQAQNALLKTIEEPPAGTVIILTASNELDLLPTVRSRVQSLQLAPPVTARVIDYFTAHGFSTAAINKALLMSDGLIGLTHALLVKDAGHPLVIATERARDLLQRPPFDRLLLIDDLAADKQAWLDILTIIERIAEINLQKTTANSAGKWLRILKAAHDARTQTLQSAQIKLVALNFMLAL